MINQSLIFLVDHLTWFLRRQAKTPRVQATLFYRFYWERGEGEDDHRHLENVPKLAAFYLESFLQNLLILTHHCFFLKIEMGIFIVGTVATFLFITVLPTVLNNICITQYNLLTFYCITSSWMLCSLFLLSIAFPATGVLFNIFY